MLPMRPSSPPWQECSPLAPTAAVEDTLFPNDRSAGSAAGRHPTRATGPNSTVRGATTSPDQGDQHHVS
jgi:hypothetical protein